MWRRRLQSMKVSYCPLGEFDFSRVNLRHGMALCIYMFYAPVRPPAAVSSHRASTGRRRRPIIHIAGGGVGGEDAGAKDRPTLGGSAPEPSPRTSRPHSGSPPFRASQLSTVGRRCTQGGSGATFDGRMLPVAVRPWDVGVPMGGAGGTVDGRVIPVVSKRGRRCTHWALRQADHPFRLYQRQRGPKSTLFGVNSMPEMAPQASNMTVWRARATSTTSSSNSSADWSIVQQPSSSDDFSKEATGIEAGHAQTVEPGQ
eukprot:gene5938-biopygen7261